MYIVAIAWAYVILMMALTSSSIGKALAIVVLLGALPLALFVYAFDRPRRRHSGTVPNQMADQRDAPDTKSDQN